MRDFDKIKIRTISNNLYKIINKYNVSGFSTKASNNLYILCSNFNIINIIKDLEEFDNIKLGKIIYENEEIKIIIKPGLSQEKENEVTAYLLAAYFINTVDRDVFEEEFYYDITRFEPFDVEEKIFELEKEILINEKELVKVSNRLGWSSNIHNLAKIFGVTESVMTERCLKYNIY